jgi:hypothetical protein
LALTFSNVMANLYYTTSGERVSQATIDRRRSAAYREAYAGLPHPSCESCGKRAEGSSHIVSQKRCKELRKSELIWDRINFYPACNLHNSAWESNDTSLPNYQRLMEILQKLDPEGYEKRQIRKIDN